MRIIFICGSLEYGHDGVGDYTRRLAGELISKGHAVGLIALNEKHTSVEITGQQTSGSNNIPVLRLPASFTYNNRLQKAKLWINEYNPEWLSLQFVPYAFNKKGMPFGLADKLAKLGKGRIWHIMFHELWIGMESNSPVKNYLSGLVQKRLIQSFIAKLKPRIIHTQSSLYLGLLTNIGLKVRYLPLFGNICHSDLSQPTYSSNGQLAANKIPPQSFILFGGIHAEAPVNEFAKDVASYCIENKMHIALTIIGRCGKEQERWATTWTAAGLPVTVLGEQPPEKISQELQKASWGIATTPAALIDKSGSAAAMLDHGLPVICVSRPWKSRDNIDVEMPAGVFEYKEGAAIKIVSLKKSEAIQSNISAITQQFLDNLSLPL